MIFSTLKSEKSLLCQDKRIGIRSGNSEKMQPTALPRDRPRKRINKWESTSSSDEEINKKEIEFRFIQIK